MRMSEDQNKNLAKAISLVEKAARKGTKIICLPELYRTRYFPQKKKGAKRPFFETVPGESTRAFAVLAKKHKVVVIVPLFEKSSKGKFFNSAIVINERGKLLPTYRKIHIPHDPNFYEKDYFEKGSDYRVYRTKYADFAVLICYDQWFPEAARVVALQGAEIIFYPTAIGRITPRREKDDDWNDAWETVMRGHAIANATHIAAVNRVGKEERLTFWGRSFIADSFGAILGRASEKKEEALIRTIDLRRNKMIRDGWMFLRNRRPETYLRSVNRPRNS